jgi:hypothetical protein
MRPIFNPDRRWPLYLYTPASFMLGIFGIFLLTFSFFPSPLVDMILGFEANRLAFFFLGILCLATLGLTIHILWWYFRILKIMKNNRPSNIELLIKQQDKKIWRGEIFSAEGGSEVHFFCPDWSSTQSLTPNIRLKALAFFQQNNPVVVMTAGGHLWVKNCFPLPS